MSTRLKVIGALFCLTGGVAALSLVDDTATGRGVTVNLLVFLLPVGLGLLKGRRSSRAWAQAWLVFGLVVGVALMGLAALAPSSVRATLPGITFTAAQSFWGFVLVDAAWLALLAWMLGSLRSSSVRGFFGARDSDDESTAVAAHRPESPGAIK